MSELFETVLILSLFGFVITVPLLLLKPVTSKRFPAKWQYLIWVAVMISMIVPVYKFIPKEEAQKLLHITKSEAVHQEKISEIVITENIEITEEAVAGVDDISKKEPIQNIITHIKSVAEYIWIIGVCVYIIFVISSYVIYLMRKRRSSFLMEDNAVFESVKKELGIKRKIKLKISADTASPMLVGVVKPTIYIPAKNISNENMRMVFLHELTHYKRMDLIVKWFSLFVNAIHWFNPIAYILCANISEVCEFSCDTEVTRNMCDEEQKNYMKTILELAE